LGKTASNASDCGGRNLFYNRFRYYDPACGRFISPDPVGLLGGANIYAYAPSTTGWIDPYGLDKETGDIGEAIAAEYLSSELGKTVLGSVQNKSGHGLDIVTYDVRTGLIEVHEVKANKARMSKDQKEGADAFTRSRIKRALKGEGHWSDKNVTRRTRFLANVVNKAIQDQGVITGLKIRVKVDKKKKTGNVVCKRTKAWVP
jgi:RHS repeat-associated protein